MRQGNASSRCRSESRRDSGHDLELDARGGERLCLLASSAEHQRIAALQAHDAPSRARARDDERVDGLMMMTTPVRAAPDRDPLGRGRRKRADCFGHELVVR
jgi:hypothetical protein